MRPCRGVAPRTREIGSGCGGVDDLRGRPAEQRTTLELTEEGRRLIAEDGFGPVFGARPLRRFISHEVATEIGRALIRGDIREGTTIRITARDGELAVEMPEHPQPVEAT
ncbi:MULTISPECIES: hypothetical protein [Kitasatospora]|uniref:Clp ATPase C-terminal domain-containing protein n=1 Tax=Kitasatospora cystarginea TaxID=58350 RepID=A0ABN3E992_9ACTN